ncbi:MAG: alpha amylase C-terminal domain-containing protein [Polyangiaceae bacterium]|nr:alpha amylase C-terminal domain-containing protein [Polyangiaceae bacterium]
MTTSGEYLSSNTPMGSNLIEDGASFRVWAPAAQEVYVIGDFNDWAPSPESLLIRDASGYWAGYVPGVREGARYKFYVVGEGSRGPKRDPYARELTADWPEPKCIVRRADFPWHDAGFKTPSFREFVVYQLHVGTFYAPRWPQGGTFLDVVHKIEHLAGLGVTCLELLSVTERQPTFGPDYSGTDLFSPEMAYGVSDAELGSYLGEVNRLLAAKGQPPLSEQQLSGALNQLKALVDLCHLYGLAVVFDLALHHAGPAFTEEGLCFFDRQQPGAPPNAHRSQYFTDQSYADGLVFAIWKPEVRQFLIDNAGYFLTEYHVDGFCHDRVNVLIRKTPSDGWHFYQELTDTLRYLKPAALEHATSDSLDPWIARPTAVGGAGFDVCLHGGLCSTIRSALVEAARPGEHPVPMSGIAAELWPPDCAQSWRAVRAIEPPTLIYRGREPRIPAIADPSDSASWYARSRSRVALGLLLTAPGIPLIFQGQELLEDSPWLDDFVDEGVLTSSWEKLKGDRHKADFLRFVHDAIALRFAEPALRGDGLAVLHAHDKGRVLAFHRWIVGQGCDLVIVASLSHQTYPCYRFGVPSGRWREVFNSDLYDHYPNPLVQRNAEMVDAEATGCDGMECCVSVTIPANSLLVFARG